MPVERCRLEDMRDAWMRSNAGTPIPADAALLEWWESLATDMPRASVDDAAPIVRVPNLIGLCCQHGWWFEVDNDTEPCPESGCDSTVFYYRRHAAHMPSGGG